MDWEIIKYYLFVGIITFIVLVIYYKYKKNHKPLQLVKFWLFWIISTVFTGTLVFVISIIYFLNTGFSDDYSVKSFNRESWITEPSKRVEMIDDLLESKRIDGMSEKEVEGLLGKPLDSTNYFLLSEYDMIYHLGIERNPVGVDSEWLLIWLNSSSVVTKYELRTD
jgi:amino acid transporter